MVPKNIYWYDFWPYRTDSYEHSLMPAGLTGRRCLNVCIAVKKASTENNNDDNLSLTFRLILQMKEMVQGQLVLILIRLVPYARISQGEHSIALTILIHFRV